MLRKNLVGVASATIMAIAATASASVQLTIRDSRVWLKAERATVAEILAEWSRVGATQMVNTERITSAPLTLDLRGVPEMDALDVIMRSAGGFVAVSRAEAVAGLSQFSRLVIVPSAANGGTRVPVTAAAPPPPPPVMVAAPVVTESGAQRLIGPDGQLVPDDQEDAPPSAPSPAPPVVRPGGGSMPPGFSEPPDAPAPAGAPRPGVITPAVPPRRPGGATSD